MALRDVSRTGTNRRFLGTLSWAVVSLRGRVEVTVKRLRQTEVIHYRVNKTVNVKHIKTAYKLQMKLTISYQ